LFNFQANLKDIQGNKQHRSSAVSFPLNNGHRLAAYPVGVQISANTALNKNLKLERPGLGLIWGQNNLHNQRFIRN
jgi:hypothetical protein